MNLFQRQVLDQLGNENVLVQCGQALEGGEQVEHVLLVEGIGGAGREEEAWIFFALGGLAALALACRSFIRRRGEIFHCWAVGSE